MGESTGGKMRENDISRTERTPSMTNLDGKVAVITGASSDIGEATAEALADERRTVFYVNASFTPA